MDLVWICNICELHSIIVVVDCCAKLSGFYNLILLVPRVCSLISVFVLFGDKAYK